MSDNVRFPKFRDLLKIAIGEDRTKNDFAKEAGLAPAQLSRLLNQPDIPRPSAATLKKIHDASHGRVSMSLLYSSCDYTPDEIGKSTAAYYSDIDPVEVNKKRAKAIISDFKAGVLSFSGKATRYDNIEDILETIDMLYGSSSAKLVFHVDNTPKDFNGRGHFNAENTVNITCDWSTDEYSCSFGFVLYVCYTKNNGVILSDAAFDLPSLFDAGHDLGHKKMIEISKVPDAVMSDYQTVYFVKDISKIN